MRRFKSLFVGFLALGFMMVGFAGETDAQRRNERDVRDLVRSLNSKIDDFQYNLDYQLKSSSADSDSVDEISNDLNDLQEKVREFETSLDARRENRGDVSDIIDAAKNIDEFLNSNPQNRKLGSDWSGIRGLLDRLAANYGVTPDWNNTGRSFPGRKTANLPAPTRSNSYTGGLNGTYQLDASRSENTADIVSGSNVGSEQKQDLESKLEAPEQIAIAIRGNQVTLASTKASPITFIADGREKTENSGGRTIRVKATLRGQELTVSSLGGETDYTVTFAATNNGQSMKVTRRITTEYLSETVFAESFYNKTDAVARLGIDPNSSGDSSDDDTYSSNDPNDRQAGRNPNPSIIQGRTGEYVVPNGTIITGILENEINTKVSQNNDRFKMTVQSPDEYRGAVIEGYVSGVGRSGKITGRSNATFNFERITLRNGQSYDFAGFLQSIKDQNGNVVKVDTEGTAKGGSQTKETAKRGGVGAGIGALIGAIAGGGKGAVIGAIIGGGAGAGSVYVQGRDDIQLLKGSTITVQSSSPIRGDQTVSDN